MWISDEVRTERNSEWRRKRKACVLLSGSILYQGKQSEVIHCEVGTALNIREGNRLGVYSLGVYSLGVYSLQPPIWGLSVIYL